MNLVNPTVVKIFFQEFSTEKREKITIIVGGAQQIIIRSGQSSKN